MKFLEFENLDSIIFDLDGTLWDASSICAKAWNVALEEMGKDENDSLNASMVRSFSGLQMNDILAKYFTFIPEQEQPKLLSLYEVYEDQLIESYGGELFPDLEFVLTELSKSYDLFIVSNCLSGYIERFLKFYELERFFIDIECSGNTNLSKEENINKIIDRNRLKKPVYVGDTKWDQEAACYANISFIYASYGFGNVPDSKFTITRIGDLVGLF